MLAQTPSRIIRLFDRELGICYWCDEPMTLELRDHAAGKPPQPGDDTATVDHLYERFDPRRWAPMKPHEGVDDRFVCACSKCNNARQRLNWAKLSDGQRETYNGQKRTFWPEFFKAQVKCRITPLVPENTEQLLSAILALHRGVRTPSIQKVLMKLRYPPLPPVPAQEQGRDHPVQAAE